MSVKVENKIALVTGANRGIGKSIVESLIQAGASKVYLAVRNVESTTELHSQFGDKVETVALDLADAASINDLSAKITKLDILVNNAGRLEVASALNPQAEDLLKQELEVNLFGQMRIAQAFAGQLEESKGAFVQLNSVASIKNFTGLSTYSASKAASYSITQSLKDEFAEKGVQVLSVHPGPIDTDMLAKGSEGTEGMEGEPTSVVASGIIESLEQGKFLLFPDSVAKQFEGAYASYAEALILPEA